MMREWRFFATLVLAAAFAPAVFGYECRIADVKGADVYRGSCLQNGTQIEISDGTLRNGVYYLKVPTQKSSSLILVKENSAKILKSAIPDSVQAPLSNAASLQISKAALGENESGDGLYFRTVLFAVNGIGYKHRRDAEKDFASLFTYFREDLQRQFPEETLSANLVFNKTSQDIYTDFIQTVLIKAEEWELGRPVAYLGYLIIMSAINILAEAGDGRFFDSEILDQIIELAKYKDEVWDKIVSSNEATERELLSALDRASREKYRAFVLGHSQGGMYTHKAFGAFPDSVRSHFYSFHVAVPTDKNPDWFLANDNDAEFVISLVLE